MKLSNLFPLLFITISCGSPKVKTQSGQSYLSAREMKIELEKAGYNFLDPVDLDTMQRLNSVSQINHRSAIIFYRNDTVLEAQVLFHVTENRDDLSKTFSGYSSFVQAIDTAADNWVKNTLRNHNVKNELQLNNEINKRFYNIQYYPDVAEDVIIVNMFSKKPEE